MAKRKEKLNSFVAWQRWASLSLIFHTRSALHNLVFNVIRTEVMLFGKGFQQLLACCRICKSQIGTYLLVSLFPTPFWTHKLYDRFDKCPRFVFCWMWICVWMVWTVLEMFSVLLSLVVPFLFSVCLHVMRQLVFCSISVKVVSLVMSYVCQWLYGHQWLLRLRHGALEYV